MNRVQAYLDTTTNKLLQTYADQNECSISHAAGKIIASYLACEEQNSDYLAENKRQFLRQINVLNQILMCVYDPEKVSVESDTARDCLDQIKKSVILSCEQSD